jgi:hypothetical protein
MADVLGTDWRMYLMGAPQGFEGLKNRTELYNIYVKSNFIHLTYFASPLVPFLPLCVR